ncbi:hypothetical protein Tco_0665079 [Tanacetum coccineum]
MSAKELVTIESKEKLLNHTGVGSWFTNIKQASNSFFEPCELNAWVPTFLEDNQDDSLSNDESKENVVEDIDGDKENKELSDGDRVSKSSFSHANDLIHENSYSNKTCDVGSHSEDPFNTYGILMYCRFPARDKLVPLYKYQFPNVRRSLDQLSKISTIRYNCETHLLPRRQTHPVVPSESLGDICLTPKAAGVVWRALSR